MLSNLLFPTQLVATPTLLGRCGSCSLFFFSPLLFPLPLFTHMLLFRICVTCQQKPATEKQLRGIFFFLSFFCASSPSTGSFTQASDAAAARCTERHLSGPVSAGGAGIDPRQSKQSEEEEGSPPPLFNQPPLGRLFLAEGPKG